MRQHQVECTCGQHLQGPFGRGLDRVNRNAPGGDPQHRRRHIQPGHARGNAKVAQLQKHRAITNAQIHGFDRTGARSQATRKARGDALVFFSDDARGGVVAARDGVVYAPAHGPCRSGRGAPEKVRIWIANNIGSFQF